jgi:hypothetical protein
MRRILLCLKLRQMDPVPEPHIMKAYGELEVKLEASLTSVLDGNEDSFKLRQL